MYTVGIKIRLLSYIIRRGRRGKAFSPKRWKACKKMCGIKNKSDAVIWYSCDKTTNINTCYVDGYTDREAMGRRLRNKKTERYTKLWSHIFIKTRVSLFGCSTEWEHCYEGEGESRYECFILRGFLFLLFLVCYENYILFIYFQHTMRCVLLLCRLHGRERRKKTELNIMALCFYECEIFLCVHIWKFKGCARSLPLPMTLEMEDDIKIYSAEIFSKKI